MKPLWVGSERVQSRAPPARYLHKMGGEAYSPNQQMVESRGLLGTDPAPFAIQVEAFRLLISIEHALNYLGTKNASVDVYRSQFIEWEKMAINAPNNWAAGSEADVGLPPVPMSHLNTFATLLDFDRPGLQPEPEAKLRNVIQEVMNLLVADESLSPHLRE